MSAYDFEACGEVIDRAAAATAAWLAADGLELESSGEMVAPHYHM